MLRESLLLEASVFMCHQSSICASLQLCSIEVDCNRGAVMAASLANGGYCPTTGNKVCGNNVTRMSKEHALNHALIHKC